MAGVSLAALLVVCLGAPLQSSAQGADATKEAGKGAQAESATGAKKSTPEATKIPVAPVGEVEIKELKTTLAVDVLAQHSKVFKTKQKIIRVAVSDPSVADVILMTENQFVVIGKNPGAISVTIWCEPKGRCL